MTNHRTTASSPPPPSSFTTISPRIGKLMLFGVLMGCVDPMLTIAATVSAKSPFLAPMEGTTNLTVTYSGYCKSFISVEMFCDCQYAIHQLSRKIAFITYS